MTQHNSNIDHMLNGSAQARTPAPGPTPSPAPGPTPSAPPPPPPPAPPAHWATPAPPASGATGSITYTQSALDRFAQTSDDRARGFQQAYGQAQHIEVSRDAFGYMFGALVYSAYEKHAQAVGDGLQSAGTAMSGIAAGVRTSADRIAAADHGIEQSANQATGG